MKTKLQIYRSAEQAAEDSLNLKTDFDVANFAMDRFKSESLNAQDWGYWKSVFDGQRQAFAQLVTQKSFSPVAVQPQQ